MLEKNLKEINKEIYLQKESIKKDFEELLQRYTLLLSSNSQREKENESLKSEILDLKKELEQKNKVLKKYAPAISNKFLFNKIRFMQRFTKNKQLLESKWGGWYLVDLDNLDNVISNVENKAQFEIKEL